MLNFGVSPISNVFYIVDAISNWDPHVRESVRREYLNRYGISFKDEGHILKYRELRKEAGGWGGLDTSFILAENINDAINKSQKLLSSDQLIELRSIFDHFYRKASYMFLDYQERLNTRKEDLEKIVSGRENLILEIIRTTASFYNAEHYPSQAVAHLMLNPDSYERGGGNANIRSKDTIHVTLVPHFLGNEEKRVLLGDLDTTFHEISHVVQRFINKEKANVTTGIIKREQQGLKQEEVSILLEAINDTLFPGGVLSIKYNLANAKNMEYKKDSKNLTTRLAYYLSPLTTELVESGESIFEKKNLKKASEIYSSFMQSEKRTK